MNLVVAHSAVDAKSKQRSVMYYLPLIHIENDIRGAGFSLRKYEHSPERNLIMPVGIFPEGGSLVEIDGFVSGDGFSTEIDIQVHKLLERIKFSYFFINPATAGHFGGYISSENFECFRLFEKHPDSSFEQKVTLSNGMYNFMHSMENYYKFRMTLRQCQIILKFGDLRYVERLSKLNIDDGLFSAIKLYNKCWETYSIHSYLDKALFARAGIEASLEHVKLKPKNFVPAFWESSLAHIEAHAKTNTIVDVLWRELKPSLDEIKSNLDSELEDLRLARHKIAHGEGQVNEYQNVPFYLIWFPVFWISTLEKEQLSCEDGIRLALFMALIKRKVDTWSCAAPPKRSHIDSYINFSRVIPKYLAKKNKELTGNCKIAVLNWIRSKR
ncbi:hypothetical protein [Pseudomonas sp. GD03696]|uniref:hypothetical protein n=1 Tax=Pseudomonas sp. GD03696 TaxID=2975368 RepID=UPI00244C55A9|nr:hypothetical protein [Pseudomonas sp. GD03696]MDH1932987.1 hypothetical protein [Pseudomonas sp. GD03696]